MSQFSGGLKTIDFVTTGKAISIVLAAAFGIVGLLTDFRHKRSRKVTGWGWVSLAGIVVSSTFGVAIQFKESSDQELARNKTAQETLNLAQTTQRTLNHVKRLLSPIVDPQFDLSLVPECDDPNTKMACEKFRTDIASSTGDAVWRDWPTSDGKGFLALNIDFFVSATDAQKYVNEEKSGDSYARPDRGYLLFASPTGKRNNVGLFSTPFDFAWVTVHAEKIKMEGDASGNITSLSDLPGCTVIMSDVRNQFAWLKPVGLTITTKDHQRVDLGDGFKKVMIGKKQPVTGYENVYPNTSGRQSNESPVAQNPSTAAHSPK
jgi:hypothetical protein